MPHFTVEVNTAERDAIEQVLQRHGSSLDNYERDLLQQLLTKIDKATPPSGGAAVGPAGGTPQPGTG